jgi:hypothetical protein
VETREPPMPPAIEDMAPPICGPCSFCGIPRRKSNGIVRVFCVWLPAAAAADRDLAAAASIGIPNRISKRSITYTPGRRLPFLAGVTLFALIIEDIMFRAVNFLYGHRLTTCRTNRHMIHALTCFMASSRNATYLPRLKVVHELKLRPAARYTANAAFAFVCGSNKFCPANSG